MGLSRIRGRYGALKVAATLKRTLQLYMYGVDIDRNIFKINTDGASVMTKLGEEDIRPFNHSTCYSSLCVAPGGEEEVV